MAHRIQRAGFVSTLILSLFAVQSGAQGKAVGAPETGRGAKSATEALQKAPVTKRVAIKQNPAKAAQKPAAAKPSTQKPVSAKVAPAKTVPQPSAKSTEASAQSPQAHHPVAKPAAKTPTAKILAGASAVLLPVSAPPVAPGCVPNLVDADFQTLPLTAFEGLNRRLEALGLTRLEADNSVRTLTERAGGLGASGSVIVARYVDSCDPRRVQVISVSLALDGPTSFTWLRGADAPSVVVAEAVMPVSATVAAPAEKSSVPVIAVEPAKAPLPVMAPEPVAIAPVVAERAVAAPNVTEVAVAPSVPAPAALEPAPLPVITVKEAPALVSVVAPVVPDPAPMVAVRVEAPPPMPPTEAVAEGHSVPVAERAEQGISIAGFSVGSFATKPDAPRRGFSDEVPVQAPLGFHLRVAGQVAEGDLGPALSAAGLPTAVVQQVLDSFAADGKMPLASAEDLSFDVLYRASSDTATDPVLTSAELSHGGQSRRLYYYVPEEGTAHLIDQDGRVRLAQGPDFIHPLPGYRMTSGFGWRQHPVLRARKFHKGVDWSAPRGTPVVAAGDGIVDTVKSHRGYGKYIRIVHDDRTETVYAHLDQFAKGIKVGQAVRQGQVIGTVGRTGIASGNHLYFELVVDGRHIDPLRNVPALVQDLLAEGKDKEDQQRFVSFADTLLQSVPATASANDAPPSYRTARTEPAPGDIP
ncbi:peptidoglycan DD-metalloendopeptidase family protein [Elstera sp.]|jgi:murein DD-endopeptidase MepM/ murein hydrolase activator NlpD|uniref:peptidoglycan DD-metalloendopeptidase family protein n=1 Tax=Elstera sp. TaxID=1916664 RepID=UPI0037C19019